MTPNDLHALQLLAALQEVGDIDLLVNADQTPTVRVTIRTPDGEYIGEALLGIRGTDEATKALGVVAEYALRKPLANPDQAADPVLHPEALAELEEHCIGLNVDELLARAETDPQGAVEAFDWITSDEGGVL